VDCNELLEQLSEYLDRRERDELCRAIEEHMDKCTDCRVVVDKTRKTIMLYQADRQVDIPLAVSSRLAAALAREYKAKSSSD
jgi:predicted anti-sigma-YlaC factor YlaD